VNRDLANSEFFLLFPGFMKRARAASHSTGRVTKRARKGTVHQRPLQQLVRLPRVDYKYTDFTSGPGSITTSGTILNLTANLVPGTGFKNNFIGREVTPTSLDIRYEVVGASSNVFAAADLNNKMRVLIFQWEDSTTPSVTGIIENAAVLSPISGINYENIDVLSDKIYSTWVNSFDATSAYGNSNSYSTRIYVKARKLMPLTWNSGNTDFQKGTIYCLVISDSAATPNPTFSIQTRLVYQDA